MRIRLSPSRAPLARPLAVLLVSLSAAAAAATLYDFQELSPGGRHLWPAGISNAGLITGSTIDGHGFVLGADGFRLFDVPGAVRTRLYQVSASGALAAGSYTSANRIDHAFTTDLAGSISFLPDLGDPLYGTGAADVTDGGLVVGGFRDSPNVDGGIPRGRAFIFDHQSVNILSAPNAVMTSLQGVNDAGLMVGQFIDTQNHLGSFLFDGHAFTPLPEPGGYGAAGASDINNLGQIVGSGVADAHYHGLVLSDGRFESLDFPGLPTRWNTFARAINDRGQIVGFYEDPADFLPHAFLATPRSAVPEPATLGLLSAALPCLLLRRRGGRVGHSRR